MSQNFSFLPPVRRYKLCLPARRLRLDGSSAGRAEGGACGLDVEALLAAGKGAGIVPFVASPAGIPTAASSARP